MIANLFREKKAKAIGALDFFRPSEPKKPQTPDEQLAVVEMLNAAFGGQDLRAKARTED